ncbi:MAG TPA: diacylglycerol kinase family protein [Pseudonocardia sp.]|jgi:diacylglycerol kinase family enzyme|uniref:diacylglycerol/lipid kinase family protein n=1 Tax=Pseudonocardia sp. TaxID=60912 RepID=UPI002B4AF28D|nr:diacylglycerol kinase family protein [Pseudonocardia sp.]HLU54793.1 diacylglycerol kinase family protein [Pseudonocardia sp.]
MARPFESVVLVFNPHSTGDAEARARNLATELGERAPDLPVHLRPTEYAGHAVEIAREEALAGRPLVVSVSGDGGYHEVVNGVMAAGTGSASAAVLAAGNANDHRRVTRERPLADSIVAGDTSRIDLLRLAIGDDEPEVRYAHSYVGLGITPAVALELERGGKGSLREIVSTVRTFSRFRPFEIETDQGRESFDSLILANIPEMAKFATLSEDGRPDDGRFEVIMLRHTAKWRVLGTAVKAAVRGLGPQPTVRDYWFRTTKPTPMQIDGELHDLDAGTPVAVSIAPGALQTVT